MPESTHIEAAPSVDATEPAFQTTDHPADFAPPTVSTPPQAPTFPPPPDPTPPINEVIESTQEIIHPPQETQHTTQPTNQPMVQPIPPPFNQEQPARSLENSGANSITLPVVTRCPSLLLKFELELNPIFKLFDAKKLGHVAYQLAQDGVVQLFRNRQSHTPPLDSFSNTLPTAIHFRTVNMKGIKTWIKSIEEEGQCDKFLF